MKRFARVVLLHPSFVHQDRVFTYSIPDSLEAGVGAVVRVPLGRTKTTGVITELLDEPDVSRTVSINEKLGPGLPREVVELADFVAARYLSSFGEALAAALPSRVAAAEKDPILAASTNASADLAFLKEYKAGSLLERALKQRTHRAFSFQPLPRESRGPMLANLAAASNGGVIVILPDLRTRTEVADALEERLGEQIAWIGSDRSNKDRYRSWLELREGGKRIAVGGRSAVFAPVGNLQLVIIDDESHFTHKEKRAPRFHARSVAAERARRANAVLVAVGVPPSVEVSAAIESGSLTSVAPSRERLRANRPSVEIVEPSVNVPGSRAINALSSVLKARRRAIVLTHRGGDDPQRIVERCAAAMRTDNAFRIDAKTSDTDLRQILRTAKLIVTTPVLAKDLALQNIGALIVVHADAALAHPDFRAPEETFSTWWRLARFAGHVVIETSKPDHPAVRSMVRWDPNILLGSEVSKRKELGYPPFGALARITAPTKDAEQIAKQIEATSREAIILGPMEHGSESIIAVRFEDRTRLAPALEELARRWRAEGSNARIDVDPRQIL
ncbi:MAG: primosomal protein N' family DNA-binding protein [Actinomycetota bacterium]